MTPTKKVKMLLDDLKALVGPGYVIHEGLHEPRDVDGREELWAIGGQYCPRCAAIQGARIDLIAFDRPAGEFWDEE